MANNAPLTYLAQGGQDYDPVLVMFILVAVILVVLWLALRWLRGLEPKETARLEKSTRSAAAAVGAAQPAAVDDLKIVEGIGPKIAAILNAAGVIRFEQLAVMTPEEISALLRAGGIRLADPHSWPQQARLAAEGKLAELQTLQESLVAGRKVS